MVHHFPVLHFQVVHFQSPRRPYMWQWSRPTASIKNGRIHCVRGAGHMLTSKVRYDTIRNAILTFAQKLTKVRLPVVDLDPPSNILSLEPT